MSREAALWGAFGPLYVNETGTFQSTVLGAYLNQTVTVSAPYAPTFTSHLGAGWLGALQLGAGDGDTATFSLSPASASAAGTLHVTATGINTTWSTNTFSILSGDASNLRNFVRTSDTLAEFDITVDGLFGTDIVFADTNSGTTLAITVSHVGHTYYVDNAGNDSNSGLSLLLPWQTCAKVNAQTFVDDDNVLFTGGQTFTGPLIPPSGGTSGLVYYGTRARPSDPDDITTYTTQSNPATISAGTGNGIATVNLPRHILDNFIISGAGVNAGSGATTSTGAAGSFKSTSATKLPGVRHIALTGTGTADGFVYWTPDGEKGWEDPIIWRMKSSATQRIGIIVINLDLTGLMSQPFAGGTKTQSSGFYIGYSEVYDSYGNVAADAQGNGIDVRNCTGGLVEYCVTHDIHRWGADSAVGGAACFGFAICDGLTRQFCEAYNCFAPAGVDGVGFDTDKNAVNCIDQYCYAHHCDGNGWLIAAPAGSVSTEHVIRYCVSANNCQESLEPVALANQGGLRVVAVSVDSVTATIYNCTIYEPLTDAIYFFGTPGDIDVLNCIVVSGTAKKCIDGTPNLIEGCCFFEIGGGTPDIAGFASIAALRVGGFDVSNTCVIGDPLLDDPTGAPSTGTLPGAAVSTLAHFDISAGSPARNIGVDLSAIPYSFDVGLVDFRGNSLTPTFDAGAVQYSNVIVLPVLLNQYRQRR